MYNGKKYEEIMELVNKILIKENIKELPIKVSSV